MSNLSFGADSAILSSPANMRDGSSIGFPIIDTLETTTKALVITLSGNIGNSGQDSVAFNINGDCDANLDFPNADLYLYDMSPMIAFNDGAENRAYTDLFTQWPEEEGTFQPRCDFTTTTVTDDFGNYTMVVCSILTTDSLFDIAITYYAPTDGADFLIGQYDYSALAPAKGVSDVFVGIIIDWDIPADLGVNNSSGYDQTKNLIWQRGAETDDTDETAGCPIKEDNRYGGLRQLSGGSFGGWTAENFPMHSGSGFDWDSLYNHMSRPGIEMSPVVTSANHDSELVDLHTGMTFGLADLSGEEVYSFVWAIATTNIGEEDLKDQLDAAYYWADSHGLLPPCDCRPGDANADGTANVADAVRIIKYVFSDAYIGPYHVCSGDANGDCSVNIGDTVHLINFVFKNGTPPPTCDQWLNGGGGFDGCGFLQ